ncbi:TonB-dependent receptor plug, partial [human gut metagenome]
KKQSLQFSMNFKKGRDGYPISTPSRKYWNADDWRRIISNATIGQFDANNKLITDPKYITPNNPKGYAPTLYGDSRNPGYHNLFALDGHYGSYSKFKNCKLCFLLNSWSIRALKPSSRHLEPVRVATSPV